MRGIETHIRRWVGGGVTAVFLQPFLQFWQSGVAKCKVVLKEIMGARDQGDIIFIILKYETIIDIVDLICKGHD